MEMIQELLGLGVEPKELDFHQICLRAVLVFLCALVMVRVSERRFLAKMTAFDFILGLILASMLSRAVNGSAPFFSTIAAGFILVFLHRILAAAAFRSHKVGWLIKGEPDVLVIDGIPNHEQLKAYSMSEKDLLEEARLNGKVESIEQIGLAVMERNGHVSVLPRKTGESHKQVPSRGAG